MTCILSFPPPPQTPRHHSTLTPHNKHNPSNELSQLKSMSRTDRLTKNSYEDYKSPPTEDEDEWKKTTFSSGGATGNPTPSASSSPDVMTELMKALSGQGST